MLGDLFYTIGSAVGGLGSRLPGKPGAEPLDGEPEEPLGHAGGLVAGAAGAWFVARALKPRPVSWTRVVIAGVAATFLADLAGRLLDQDGRPRKPPLQDDPETLVRRYGTGIATAAGYASLLYPRIPGSPLVRGLVFGALEMAAAQRGGLVRLAADIPGLRYPLQNLALPTEDEPGPMAHMAFGLGLGLFYRHDPDDQDYENGDFDPD